MAAVSSAEGSVELMRRVMLSPACKPSTKSVKFSFSMASAVKLTVKRPGDVTLIWSAVMLTRPLTLPTQRNGHRMSPNPVLRAYTPDLQCAGKGAAATTVCTKIDACAGRVLAK